MIKSKPSPPASKPNRLLTILVFFFLTLVFLLLMTNLGRDPLFDWDEGIYAQLGAELLKSGKLFTNTWNYSSWFEKPPGISWLSGLGQALAGHTPFGARLFMPAVSTLTLYMLYLLGTKLKNYRVGLLSLGFLIGFNLFLGRTRALNTDIPLLLGIITAFYFALTKKPAWQVALIIAASVWFKGLAGFLALLIPLPTILRNYSRKLRPMIFYLALLILPWHLYAYFVYQDTFFTPYFMEQVVRRATVPIEFHLESRWFYFTYLYENLGSGAIIVLAIGLAVMCIKFLKTNDYRLANILWWFFFPLALFTLAKTRLFWYLLPIYPAISLILAYLIDSFATSRKTRLTVFILALAVLAQSVMAITRSVELTRHTADLPDRLVVASTLSNQARTLAVLVPATERIAEAVLPVSQRISSSFRYGGMPSVVYYYQGPVRFFYNLDEFRSYWENDAELALIHKDDLNLLENANIIVTTPTYLGVAKEGTYAQR